jgi:integrase
VKITMGALARLRYSKAGKAADYRWDDQLRGFGARIYPSGRVAFVVSYRSATGTKRFYTLGDFGELTVDQARRLAQDRLAEVRAGHDPQAERQERRREITVAELANRYLDHVRHRKRSWDDDQQRLRDHILPELGHKKISETLSQIERLHASIKDARSPATANRCAALLKHMFNLAVKWRLLPASPAFGLSLFREPPPRDIVLTPEQCRRLLTACEADENPYAAALFKLALLTGRRVGELLALRWSEVDLERRVLTLPQTKAGERQFVHLNEPALNAISCIPKIAGNPFVIAGEKVGKPLNFYRRAWLRILKRAAIAFFPVHGLRHNFASMLVAEGIPLETVGHLLGHKHSVTTRKYAHHRPEHLQKATGALADVIDLRAERERRAS